MTDKSGNGAGTTGGETVGLGTRLPGFRPGEDPHVDRRRVAQAEDVEGAAVDAVKRGRMYTGPGVRFALPADPAFELTGGR